MRTAVTKKTGRFFPILFALLWAIAGGVLLAARSSAQFAELVFAQKLYRVYRTAIAHLTGALPFCLAEWVLYAFVAGVLIALTLWCVHMISGRGRRGRIFLRGCLHSLSLLGVVFFLFVFGCGGNYYRATYAQLAGCTVEPATQEELYALCTSLAQQANTLREELAAYEDGDGVFSLPYSLDTLGEAASAAMTRLGAQEPSLAGYYPRPKQVAWSRALSRFGITGVYFPFTVEANVNVDAPDYTIGAAMCHELSHVAGFMREGEANYLAYRACLGSEDPVLAYSGTMLALSYAVDALDSAQSLQVWQSLDATVLRDLAAASAYWSQFENTVTTALGETINDTYLRANNQSGGIQSYGEMVDLLLAELRQK